MLLFLILDDAERCNLDTEENHNPYMPLCEAVGVWICLGVLLSLLSVYQWNELQIVWIAQTAFPKW